MFGRLARSGGVPAATTAYRDAKSGTEVQVHHARLDALEPRTDYVYAAVHNGAQADLGTLTTAPRGWAPLTSTSYGDRGTPPLGKLSGSTYVNGNLVHPRR
jgi:hypothetical protein